jgi:hypothetical protein
MSLIYSSLDQLSVDSIPPLGRAKGLTSALRSFQRWASTFQHLLKIKEEEILKGKIKLK